MHRHKLFTAFGFSFCSPSIIFIVMTLAFLEPVFKPKHAVGAKFLNSPSHYVHSTCEDVQCNLVGVYSYINPYRRIKSLAMLQSNLLCKRILTS